MTTVQEPPLALGDSSARQLANATKTTAQMTTITPRWLVHLLPWQPVDAGIYRLNKVRHPESVDIACPGHDESVLPQTFVDYEDQPREYLLGDVNCGRRGSRAQDFAAGEPVAVEALRFVRVRHVRADVEERTDEQQDGEGHLRGREQLTADGAATRNRRGARVDAKRGAQIRP